MFRQKLYTISFNRLSLSTPSSINSYYILKLGPNNESNLAVSLGPTSAKILEEGSFLFYQFTKGSSA